MFRIVNEATRDIVENPLERAISEGRAVGLANHAKLIARDGSEIFIDDSAAPFRNDIGDLIGAVLVFRDISPEETVRTRDRTVRAGSPAIERGTAAFCIRGFA